MYWIILALSNIFPVALLSYVFKSRKIDFFDEPYKNAVLTVSGLGVAMSPISILIGISLCGEGVFYLDVCIGTFLIGWIFPVCLLIFILNKVMLPNINVRGYSKRSCSSLCDKKFRGKLLRRLGISIMLIPAAFFLFVDNENLVAQLSGEDSYDVTVEMIILVIILLGGFLTICLSNYNFRFWSSHKESVTEKIRIQEIDSNKAPIVLLRSFEIMVKYGMVSATYDENLFSPFVREGYPVISLADPDVAKYGGSIKFEAKDDSWQEAIELILSRTSAVIMLEGKTEGLQWEISRVKKFVTPEHFFVITLPEKMRMDCWYPKEGALFIPNRKKKALRAFDFIWRSFSAKLVNEKINTPQENPGNGAILFFDKDWNVSKKAYYKDGDELSNIIKSTIGESVSDFNYQELYNKISQFEVQKNIPSSYLDKFKKYSKVIRWCIWGIIPLSLLIMCVMADL